MQETQQGLLAEAQVDVVAEPGAEHHGRGKPQGGEQDLRGEQPQESAEQEPPARGEGNEQGLGGAEGFPLGEPALQVGGVDEAAAAEEPPQQATKQPI